MFLSQELNSSLYQLAYNKIGFITCCFTYSPGFQEPIPLSEDLLYVFWTGLKMKIFWTSDIARDSIK